MRWLTKPSRLSGPCLVTVLLSGCGGTTVPIANPSLCEAWPEIQVCPQDKISDGPAQTMIRSNVGRRTYGCAPPPKASRPDCTEAPQKLAAAR